MHPGNERLLHAQACALRLAGDAESAVAAFEALLSSHSRATRNPKTWHALGGALRDAGRFDDAVDAFERGAFCRFADDGSLNNEMDAYAKMDGMETFVNLPCLTSAAAEAARGGDAARARRLFARGSALASPGEDALSPFETFFDTFETDGGSTVDGSTVSVSNATDRGANDARGARWPSRNTRGTRAARSGFQKDAVSARPSAHERSTHLRMWAAFEKRDGRYVTARALFARASRANPGDALVWLQWGQFERRVEGPDAARTRFQSGAKRLGRASSARAFLYQSWADFEASVGDVYEARAVSREHKCHPGSELWLARGAFEAELARARTTRPGDGDAVGGREGVLREGGGALRGNRLRAVGAGRAPCVRRPRPRGRARRGGRRARRGEKPLRRVRRRRAGARPGGVVMRAQPETACNAYVTDTSTAYSCRGASRPLTPRPRDIFRSFEHVTQHDVKTHQFCRLITKYPAVFAPHVYFPVRVTPGNQLSSTASNMACSCPSTCGCAAGSCTCAAKCDSCGCSTCTCASCASACSHGCESCKR